MNKADPEELRALADDLKRVRKDHANILTIEPQGVMKAPLEQIIRYAEKRYEDVGERCSAKNSNT